MAPETISNSQNPFLCNTKFEMQDMVFEMETGHCGYLSQPGTVAMFIRRAAGEKA